MLRTSFCILKVPVSAFTQFMFFSSFDSNTILHIHIVFIRCNSNTMGKIYSFQLPGYTETRKTQLVRKNSHCCLRVMLMLGGLNQADGLMAAIMEGTIINLVVNLVSHVDHVVPSGKDCLYLRKGMKNVHGNQMLKIFYSMRSFLICMETCFDLYLIFELSSA